MTPLSPPSPSPAPPTAQSAAPPYDVEAARADFPALAQQVHGRPLCFLDSAASAQKPRQVLEAMRGIWEHCYANVHRGAYAFSERSTTAYEDARRTVQAFLNARSAAEIVFTANATMAINLVAHAFGRGLLKPGDEIILTELEHHANIVPWQLLRDAHGVVLKVAAIDDDGVLTPDAVRAQLTERTALVALTHTSNALGTVTPLAEIVQLAHDAGARVLVDGSQRVMHAAVDVQALDCDFYVFTGHKIYGPTGIGVLWARETLLEAMPPFLGGGDMIASVTFERSTWAEPPAKFEAGTPPILEAVGLAAALDYVQALGLERIAAHEQALLRRATERLESLEGVHIVGRAPEKGPVLSFTVDGAHPHDVATILDRQGIAVRAGHHCAQPLMQRLGLTGTARASFALYNTQGEVEALAAGLARVREILGP